MANRSRTRAPRRWYTWPVRVLALLVSGAIVATSGVLAYRSVEFVPHQWSVRVVAAASDRTVRVDEGEPLASALLEAGVVPRDGRLLSAGTGRVLDSAADPAVVTLDGRPAEPDAALAEGSVVEVVDGADTTEATEAITSVIEPPPFPDVWRHVQEAGAPGESEQVVGVQSREVVSERVVRAAIPPSQTTRKVVALTFDDGPTTAWTPLVLQVLREKGVKATFCQVGTNVDAHPELSAQILREGHRLCNHTVGHDEGLQGAGQDRLDAQIVGGADTFARHDLPKPGYYRPPGGFLDDAIVATAHGQGEQVLYWKVDTEDWRTGANVLTILDKVLKQVDSGAIILMHDGGGSDRAQTVFALSLTIDLLRQQGYTFTFPTIDRPAR